MFNRASYTTRRKGARIRLRALEALAPRTVGVLTRAALVRVVREAQQ